MSLEPSQTLESIGNYDLIEKIAEGGMGAVWKARHHTTGDIVAIKIVPPNTARNPTLLRRFEREFSAAFAIDHEHVVKAIEFNGSPPTPFLVMEYVDGESLGQRIDREGKLSEVEAKRIIVQVCQGLHRAHKHHLVHRDVKPDNVLLTKEGVAKITDLGLVKGVGEEEMNLTRTGRGLGTPHFMAPEQFRDAKNADILCDVYSVGATMYMMVTGVMPFDGTGPLDCWMKKIQNNFRPPLEIAPELSERTNSTILRAMSADPKSRPASCREFVEDLIGQSTRPVAQGQAATGTIDLWYLVYQDEENASHTVKGSTDGIRRALKENLLGDTLNIVASRDKAGPFNLLSSYPEFRDLVVKPAPMPTKSARPTPPPEPKAPSNPRLSSPSNRVPPPSARATQPAGRASAPIGPVPLNVYPEPDDQEPVLPMIDLKPHPTNKVEWLMYVMLFVLALATAMAVYLKFLR